MTIIPQVRLTEADTWLLSRWFLGDTQIPDGLAVDPLLAGLVASHDPNSPEHQKVMRTLFKPHMADIIRYGPDDPAPAAAQAPDARQSPTLYIPKLPAEAQLTDDQMRQAEQAGRWLTRWTRWATERSPITPPEFLLAGGIYLIGLAVARRACLQMHERIYPHLYILWVATTTRYAKSTGLKCVSHTAQLAMPHMLLPKESTPEALMNNLAGILPENMGQLDQNTQARLNRGRLFAAQRGFLIDEASSLLGAARKDYMQGLQELLLKAYDAPDEETRSTRGGGLVVVRRLGLSILGATTPAAMARNVDISRWEDGDMARYVILYPDGPTPYTDNYGQYDPPSELIDQLRKLHESLPQPTDDNVSDQRPPETVTLAMDEAARTAYRQYRRAMVEMSDDLDPRLHGNYGRMPTQGLKVATALALIDWTEQAQGNRPMIQAAHWYRAQMICESWRGSLHRALMSLDEHVETKDIKRLELLLKSSPSGLYLRSIQRGLGMSAKAIENALHVLIESGDVEVQEWTPPNGGWSTKVYRWRVMSSDTR